MKIDEKNELEQLFVSAVEDVKREVLRRRTKINAMLARKPWGAGFLEEDFEKSLDKLVGIGEARIKSSELTPNDRCNLLDVFVHSEKVKILTTNEVGSNANVRTTLSLQKRWTCRRNIKKHDLRRRQQPLRVKYDQTINHVERETKT